MTRYRRERPLSRKALLSLCREYDCTLEELLCNDRICLSHDLRIQARKMIEEGRFSSAKEIRDFEKEIRLYRLLRLIK